MTSITWQTDAYCATGEFDPETWFPHASQSPKLPLALCRTRCPVRAQCLTHALDTNSDAGIFGGTTPGQRARMRRRNRGGS